MVRTVTLMSHTVFPVTGQWPNITMCSIERKTVPSDKAVAPILFMHVM